MTMQLSLTIDNIGLADLGQMKLNEFRKIFIETIRRYNFDNFKAIYIDKIFKYSVN